MSNIGFNNNNGDKSFDYIADVFNFAAINIPLPNEKINSNKDADKNWVQWGDNNLYPMYLINLLNKSSLHSSILKNKAMFVCGQGWEKTNLSPEAILFLKNVYNQDDLDELLFKIGMDLELYGMFYLNVIWSKSGERISEINYIDPSKVRIQPMDPNGKYPQIENYWVCDGWEDTKKYKPILYPGFSTTKKKKKSQILQVKEYRPGTEWYGRPEYESGVRWIELEWEISNLHLSNIQNGMFPMMQVNYASGIPSDEERANIIARTRRQFEGSRNAGNVLFTFSEKNMPPNVTITPIETNQSHELFLMLNEQVVNGVLYAHRVTNPSLFGIKLPGELGGRDEMLESLEIFVTQYIEPKQRIIEKVFNWFARLNGIKDRFIINKYSPQFSKINTKLKDLAALIADQNISAEQKFWMLVQNDYDHITAMRISGFKEGNNLKGDATPNKEKPKDENPPKNNEQE